MKLPEPSQQELFEQFINSVPSIHKTSTDTAMTTPGAIATVIIAGVIFSACSPLWLLLAVPLALVAWASEAKWWRR